MRYLLNSKILSFVLFFLLLPAIHPAVIYTIFICCFVICVFHWGYWFELAILTQFGLAESLGFHDTTDHSAKLPGVAGMSAEQLLA